MVRGRALSALAGAQASASAVAAAAAAPRGSIFRFMSFSFTVQGPRGRPVGVGCRARQTRMCPAVPTNDADSILVQQGLHQWLQGGSIRAQRLALAGDDGLQIR